MYSSWEYCFTETPPRHIRRRKNWNKHEREILMNLFNAKAYPEKEELCQLAKSLNTSYEKISRWFCRRRLEKKAQQMLLESE